MSPISPRLACPPRMRDLEREALHVPRAGGTPLGAKPAMQADVLVLHHHSTRGQRSGDIEILLQVRGRGLKAGPQVRLLALGGEGDAIHPADIDARRTVEA